jgi:hypothetical protein
VREMVVVAPLICKSCISRWANGPKEWRSERETRSLLVRLRAGAVMGSRGLDRGAGREPEAVVGLGRSVRDVALRSVRTRY